MKFFYRLFHKKANKEIPQIPSWESIVEMMHDKYLDAFASEVIDVICSKDDSMRYVVLKNEKGFFTYQLEAIYQFDEEEWKYICSNNDALPAMWEPFRGIINSSIFENFEERMNSLKFEPEYKRYFL